QSLPPLVERAVCDGGSLQLVEVKFSALHAAKRQSPEAWGASPRNAYSKITQAPTGRNNSSLDTSIGHPQIYAALATARVCRAHSDPVRRACDIGGRPGRRNLLSKHAISRGKHHRGPCNRNLHKRSPRSGHKTPCPSTHTTLISSPLLPPHR